MSAIRSKGNATTEKLLAQLLRRQGLNGWRRHAQLPGRPDYVFPKEKVAIFVDGCFWHACPRCYHEPKKNVEFWLTKFQNNRARDRRVTRQLRSEGWKVLRVWEHALTVATEGNVLRRIERALNTGRKPDRR